MIDSRINRSELHFHFLAQLSRTVAPLRREPSGGHWEWRVEQRWSAPDGVGPSQVAVSALRDGSPLCCVRLTLSPGFSRPWGSISRYLPVFHGVSRKISFKRTPTDREKPEKPGDRPCIA